MKSFPKNKFALVASLAVAALLLSACGGGGGGSDSGSAVPPASPVTVVTAPVTQPVANELVTTPVVPTYVAGDYNKIVFDGLNTLRAATGSGLYVQNAKLDAAATAHFNYVKINATSSGHTETAGTPGFTGVDPGDRSIAAGYGAGTNEVMAGFGGANRAADCVASWENSVYHMEVILGSARDVGVGAGETSVDFNGTPLPMTTCVVDFSVQASAAPQLPAPGTIVVYPYDGQTGVIAAFNNRNEFPTPVADLNGVGHPVGLRFIDSITAVGSLTITPAGGTAVAARILAAAQATGPGVVTDSLVPANTVYLVPEAALVANTVYTVAFSGTVGGKAASKTWTFTTKP